MLVAALACVLFTGCEGAGSGGSPALSAAFLVPETERIGAVVFDAHRAPTDSVLVSISELGTSHLALVSFGFQEAADNPQLRFTPDVRWFSESEDGARALSRRAGELGMGIILKPQIWIRGGSWSGEINFDREKEWEIWEDAYRSYLMHTARLAEEIDADLLIIGTELSIAVREREAFWRTLIEDVRSTYSGPITYGANWHDDYLNVPFWDALDVIGVQAYFPLSNEPAPDLDAIRDGWNSHLKALQALSTREQRRILFTELGYRSVPDAAEHPWRWPSRDEQIDPDFRLQADLYRGFFESIWMQPWFAGAVLWKFYPDNGRRGHDTDFTPQGKPAEEVVRSWFMRAD